MFTNQDIIAIAFKIINFTALLGVFIILFKKYIMPDILLGIARKKNKQDSLFLQQASLEKQQLNLDLLLKEESLQCEKFRLKIDEWKKAIAIEHEHYEKKHSKTLSLVRKRTAYNALRHEKNRVQNIVIHAVVSDIKKSLSTHFQKPKQNSEYLDSILHFMNESAS